jgi:hypothetical protein
MRIATSTFLPVPSGTASQSLAAGKVECSPMKEGKAT